jgi:putative transposase
VVSTQSKTKRTYRYRFYPTQEQAGQLARTFGCGRFVYNWGLATRKHAYFHEGKSLSYNGLAAMLPALKEEYPFLSEVSAVPLQQTLRHLERAFVNFFEGRADYPVFKKKRNDRSATYAANAFTWDGSTLTLAKMEAPLDIRWHRPLPKDAKPSSVTVSRDGAGRYFISILVQEEIAKLAITPKTVGLDLGLTSFVVTSDGEDIPNPKYYRQNERKLAKAQQRHARKKKGSKNREKARKKVARLHARIADCRRDYQHQRSTRLMHENQVVCVESLAVKNMVKNPHLSKSISDVGWGEFTRQLGYKAAWYGRFLVKIDRFFPSTKRCSACGYVLEELDLSVREWVCPNCGVTHQRDHNAAKNVWAEGLSVLAACGGSVRHGEVRASHAAPGEAGTSAREGRSPAL